MSEAGRGHGASSRGWATAIAAGALALGALAVREGWKVGRRPRAPVRAFVGLGSNLGDRASHLADAADRLEGPALRIVRRSKIYETPPWGKVDQPPFLNQALEVETALGPRALLARCLAVERALGRVRGERWGPRVIDVDILLYGIERIRARRLIVPHAELHRRAFALVPLLELDPELRLPDGRAARDLLGALSDRGDIVPWSDPARAVGPADRRPLAEGVPIEHYTRGGIAAGLDTRVVGRHVRWYDTLPSTNELAMRLAEARAPEGTVVVAEEQTAGRGRLGRAWVSPRGGIWCSVILRPRLPLEQIPLIGLAAAVGAARAIRVAARLAARVKWPNDVLVDGRKVAGVLTEAGPGPDWIVVGIGINANVDVSELPQESRQPAGSLADRAGAPVDRGEVMRVLLRELDRAYALLQEPAGAVRVLRSWREAADTLGRTVRVEGEGRTLCGVAEDLDDLGALLVRTPDGALERVVAGEVTLRGAE